jgi:hypothetical protein
VYVCLCKHVRKQYDELVHLKSYACVHVKQNTYHGMLKLYRYNFDQKKACDVRYVNAFMYVNNDACVCSQACTLHTYMHAYIHICMLTICWQACTLNTYMHTYVRTYLHVCMHAYMHAHNLFAGVYFVHDCRAYIHTCMHTYIHVCIHTYMHTVDRVRIEVQEHQKSVTSKKMPSIHS